MRVVAIEEHFGTHKAVAARPDRFATFAALPTSVPEEEGRGRVLARVSTTRPTRCRRTPATAGTTRRRCTLCA